MLAFVAADPMEFAGLRKHCARVEAADLPVDWARTAELHGNRIVMIANGAGARRAAMALDAARDITAVVSTGFCGALDPGLGIGDIFVATSIGGVAVDPPLAPANCAKGELASIDHVAQTAQEKQNLRASGAAAVEMEAAGVQKRARSLGLPFFCVRSVTDLANETFANDLNSALRDDGHFDTMQILRSSLRNPVARIGELVRLRQRCGIAARRLGDFLADCRF
jgi:nucleoside phosphorylase